MVHSLGNHSSFFSHANYSNRPEHLTLNRPPTTPTSTDHNSTAPSQRLMSNHLLLLLLLRHYVSGVSGARPTHIDDLTYFTLVSSSCENVLSSNGVENANTPYFDMNTTIQVGSSSQLLARDDLCIAAYKIILGQQGSPTLPAGYTLTKINSEHYPKGCSVDSSGRLYYNRYDSDNSALPCGGIAPWQQQWQQFSCICAKRKFLIVSSGTCKSLYNNTYEMITEVPECKRAFQVSKQVDDDITLGTTRLPSDTQPPGCITSVGQPQLQVEVNKLSSPAACDSTDSCLCKQSWQERFDDYFYVENNENAVGCQILVSFHYPFLLPI